MLTDVYSKGQLQSSTLKSRGGRVLSSQNYAYDPLWRNTGSTDVFGTSSVGLRPDDSGKSITLPNVAGQPARTYQVPDGSWDPTKQIALGVTRPDGSATQQRVNPVGQTISSWGAGTTPVGSGYDPNTGQLTSIKTFTGNVVENTADTEQRHDQRRRDGGDEVGV